MAKKKADLEQENEELHNKLRRAEERDAKMRREFAKVFGWFKIETRLGEQKEVPRDMSWQEIFHEIGRLQEAKTRLTYIDDIQEHLNLEGENADKIKELEDTISSINISTS